MFLLNIQYVHHLDILTPLNECNLIKQLSWDYVNDNQLYPKGLLLTCLMCFFSIFRVKSCIHSQKTKRFDVNVKANTWAFLFVCFVSVCRTAKKTGQLHEWWILITVLTELFLLKLRAIPAVASDPVWHAVKRWSFLLTPLQSHWRVTVSFLQSVEIWRQHYPQQL